MKKNAGYSLVELMLTVVFVMLGSQLIQGGFLRAADVFGRYSHTLKATLWASEEIARAREALLKTEETGRTSGTQTLDGKEFQWNRQTRSLPGIGLYAISLDVSWTESGKSQTLQKEIYVHRKDPSRPV